MSIVELASRLRSLWGTRSARLLSLARLAGLAALLWGAANQLQPGIAGRRWAVPVLMLTVATSWMGWMASRRLQAPDRITWVFLTVLAASGGILAGFAPVAVGVVAVAALGRGDRL